MSVEVKTPTRTQFEHTEFLCGEKQLGNSNANESCEAEEINSGQKRKLSLAFDTDGGESQRYQDGQKYRRRKSNQFRQDQSFNNFRRKRLKSSPADIVLPTKFLLGGNINDPLNLNSMNDEEINKMLNEKTPHSSPLPTPVHRQKVDVHIPTNITDPLNLNSCDEDGSAMKKKKKRHNKNKKKDEELAFPGMLGVKDTEKNKGLMEALKIEVDDNELDGCADREDRTKVPDSLNVLGDRDFSNKFQKPNKIVSPVIPQSSPEKFRRIRRRTLSMSDAVRPDTSSFLAARSILRTSLSPPRQTEPEKITPPKKTKRHSFHKHQTPTASKLPKFIHGNYNRYYGYRNPDLEEDHRLKCFKREWFEEKEILDIGCNVGHLTLDIAKEFNPSNIVGIDIDPSLISAARKNIRHYLSSTTTTNFPISNTINYGPISAPPVGSKTNTPMFPNNVAFVQGNYVLERDQLLDLQKEEYDTILALSITKWIHLNNGDSGLKRFFKRIYKQLKPGGHLILEPQPWSSYKKKKKLSPTIHENFQSITLKPEQFTDYLLSKEVGFNTCEVVDLPFNKSKGFRRPIQLFTKADTAVNSPKQQE